MSKVIITTGKRKRAVARATLREGKGDVRVNGQSLSTFTPIMSRQRIQEPLILAGDLSSKIMIDVAVHGGGFSSQAEAARLAAARAILQYSKDKKLKENFLAYDRHLLVADVRRKESAKPNRHSQARAKTQKSYR